MPSIRVGIVGADGLFITPSQEGAATTLVEMILTTYMRKYDMVYFRSGHCPAGGIDIISENLVDKFHSLGKNITKEGGIFPPADNHKHWMCSAKSCMGFKNRNILIADADYLHNIVLGKQGAYCYHCDEDHHRRSGGCWTLKHFRKTHPAANGFIHIL